MYMPDLLDARHVGNYLLDSYLAMLFTDCKSAGVVEYTHVLFVYEFGPERTPDKLPPRVMAVAAEANGSALVEGGSHFLGVFPGSGHMNLGDSDAWADLDTFTAKALEIVTEHLNIAEPPHQIS